MPSLAPQTPEHPLVDLQRSSGNAAVARLVAGLSEPASPRRLARYEAGEHSMFGSTKKDLTVAGIKVSQADVIALGDLYETPEELAKADKGELKKLLALIEQDREAYETGKGKAVKNEEWEAETAGRRKRKPTTKTFLELAEDNAAHFAPPKAGGTAANHKSEWERLHKQALDKAHAAAVTDKKVPEEARTIDAFAAHFLTDAFAAGHLVAKSDLVAQARLFWDKLLSAGTTTNFTDAVAKRVLADAGARKQLSKHVLTITGLGPFNLEGEITEPKFARLLNMISGVQQDRFLGAFAKLVHDKLNEQAATPAGGIEVENAAGDKWKLSGDKTLAKSGDTLRIGKKALAQSAANLDLAARTPGALQYPVLFDNVWQFVPKPTKTGDATVQALVQKFADAAQPDTVEAFAKLTIEELPIAIGALTAAGHIQPKPKQKPKAPPKSGTRRPVPAGTP